MRYFGVSLQFFAVFINLYLLIYSIISLEGIYSVLRNSGCKTLGLDSGSFAPRGPGFNPWAVHGGTSGGEGAHRPAFPSTAALL